MAIKPIQILINAKDNASSVFSSLGAKVTALGATIATFIGIKAFSGAVQSAEALDVQMRKLNAVINATGGAAGLTAEEIDDMARRLDEATTGSAEGFRDAATQLLTFKSVGKDAFETTLLLAQDLADAGFGSLTSNAVQLGKALENPVQGLSALTESGVTFTKEQQKVIKLLVETGRAADAQKVILDAVAGQVGGTAKAIGGGLTGAIDLVNARFKELKEQLGAAVLPVFQRFNELVAETYQRLTDDGTVGRFGEAIARGFQVALDWAQAFLSQVDFTALGAKASSAADQVGEAFNRLSGWATNAGNSVKLAYGVMSSGANLVLSGIYKIGEAFAGVASNITGIVARLAEAWSRIGFGEAAERMRKEAEGLRTFSEGLWAVSEALAQRAQESFQAAGDSAVVAREGFSGLIGEVAKTATGLDGASEAQNRWRETVEKSDKAAKAAAKAQQEKAAADKAAADAIAVLRQEYAGLIAKGDLQAAALKLQEINQALKETPSAVEAAKKASVEVASAFKTLGIETQQDLQDNAEKLRKAYELAKASGLATAESLREGFKKVAEAEIAASGGVATQAQRSEAAMRGLEIATDSTGKTIVRALAAGEAALKGFTGGIVEAQAQVQQLDGYMERLAKRNADVKSSITTDGQGFAVDAQGSRLAAGGDLTTLTGIAAFLKAAGVDDDEAARSIAKEFANSKGEVQYFNNPGQRKYGGEFSTISDALLKAAERYTFGGAGVGGAKGTSGSSAIPKQSREVTVNVNFNGEALGPVNTDASGSAVIEDLMRRLERGKRSSA
jgi:hypothetical protein